MKPPPNCNPTFGFSKTLATLLATVLIAGFAFTLWSAETNAVDSKAAPPEVKKTAARRQLSGAELYSIHCNRCHPERYPTERTAAQWKTIVLHMEVRANLPRSQAQLILKYLQDNSGR